MLWCLFGWRERKGGDGSSPTYQAVISAHRAGPVAFVSSRGGGQVVRPVDYRTPPGAPTTRCPLVRPDPAAAPDPGDLICNAKGEF